jgi:hypothetical protein
MSFCNFEESAGRAQWGWGWRPSNVSRAKHLKAPAGVTALRHQAL